MTTNDLSIKDKVLQTMSGRENKEFSRKEIIEMVVQRYPGTNPASVLPSDLCYNIINNGIQFRRDSRMFEWKKKGVYKFLGTGVQYNGLVTWKGSKYGEWKDGVFRKFQRE